MPMVDLIKGMDFGSGVDLGGQIFGDAVLRSAAEEIPGTGGKTEDIFLTLVESQEDQDSALSLSTSVSASYGLFGGSAKFDLSQEMHVHTFAISLVIRATVLNTFSQMRDVKFGPEATSQLTNGQNDRFREQFGDTFVRGIQTGGELCAILQIIGHDESDQSSIKADLQAGGILGAVSVSTSDSFSSSVRKATSGREVKLRHFQIGGNPQASINPDDMVTHALNFAAEVKAGQSGAFQALVISYKTVDTPLAPNFVDLENAKETLALLMQKRRDALTRLTSFNFVIAHPEQFAIPPGTNVNAIVGRFETAVAALTSAASRCVNKPKEAPDALTGVAGLDIPVDDLPPRRSAAPLPPLPGPPPLDTITQFALFANYPNALAQMKNELPHSTPQVQSDAALGFAWDLAIAQATANTNSPGGGVPNFADMNSPIQLRANDKAVQMEPNIAAFGAGKFPDAADPSGLPGLLSLGVALRQAMQEFGEDVSKITFS